MPESRDRLVRPVDHAAIFARRRTPGTGILIDDPEVGPNLFGSPAPVRQVATPATRGRFIGGRGGFGTPRHVRGRNLYRTPASGQENNPRTAQRSSGRGRPRSSVLPSWYPRTPLRDITAVVRAIERTRARLGDVEGQQIESTVPEGQRVLDPSVTQSSAQLKHNISMVSPSLAVGVKPRTPAVGKVPKILLGITNQNAGESEFLTPQKKLLNSIDTVEKVVMEELQKLKRTPSAKKAEREKRIRTLMSMR
ncbi:protein POLYCHOME-like isoform X2 [Quercus robur]|uniref:Protein POLYCHOME n=1 Tax=Quercus lobata TaxID=97700 RepID=A0A7N2M316_QUELO|nr:protein POLYCHOME-like [Quercus lobata]XP_050244666.1 protein POLYCHOME-like isoform X2 [Quercus robur]